MDNTQESLPLLSDDYIVEQIKRKIDQFVQDEGRVPDNWHDVFGPAVLPLPGLYSVAVEYMDSLRAELQPSPVARAASLRNRARGSATDVQAVPAKRSALLPVRHLQRDFFLCDLFDYALKGDMVTMEAPIFSLSTKKDLTKWHWRSADGKREVIVTPSVDGRATQHDKDVLIYITSQMTEALNRKRSDTDRRTVRFTAHDYFVATNRGTAKDDYVRFQESLDRLKGTTIKTNIETGGAKATSSFGLIDRWSIVQRSTTDGRMVAVEVVISDWLHRAIIATEVLTMHRDYFRLRKPLERRLYELARKHCGAQQSWKCGLALLQEKSGSRAQKNEFHRMLKKIKDDDAIPDYRLDLQGDLAIFTARRQAVTWAA